ncbi:MAG: hypothetical protein HFE95_07790 [Acutalibacter sp.]|jgi:hypothetical protein|nr:hypothetical protein [Acutalibacter sp.]
MLAVLRGFSTGEVAASDVRFAKSGKKTALSFFQTGPKRVYYRTPEILLYSIAGDCQIKCQKKQKEVKGFFGPARIFLPPRMIAPGPGKVDLLKKIPSAKKYMPSSLDFPL